MCVKVLTARPPRDAVYSDDIDGLEQYRSILPWLGSMLSSLVGATMIIRRPVDAHTDAVIQEINDHATSSMVDGVEDSRVIAFNPRYILTPSERRLAKTVITRAFVGGRGIPKIVDVSQTTAIGTLVIRNSKILSAFST